MIIPEPTDSGEVADLLQVIAEHKTALLPFVNAYVALNDTFEGVDVEQHIVEIRVSLADLRTAFTVYKD